MGRTWWRKVRAAAVIGGAGGMAGAVAGGLWSIGAGMISGAVVPGVVAVFAGVCGALGLAAATSLALALALRAPVGSTDRISVPKSGVVGGVAGAAVPLAIAVLFNHSLIPEYLLYLSDVLVPLQLTSVTVFALSAALGAALTGSAASIANRTDVAIGSGRAGRTLLERETRAVGASTAVDASADRR